MCDGGSQNPQHSATFSKNFAAVVLLGNEADEKRLLSVRAVATMLGLCTATVYGLCADGTLPHVRVLNVIRFRRFHTVTRQDRGTAHQVAVALTAATKYTGPKR